MNTKRTVIGALTLLVSHIGSVAAADVGRESEVVFVEEGSARYVREIGNKWASKEGALVCGGTGNFLVAGNALGAGDFRIRARLSLERLDGTAASLAFGQNHFGFDGRSGKLFVEGAELGSTRSVGNTADVIAPGRPFDVEIVQHGFIPLVPRGSKRIYAFGTQPIDSLREGAENCPIGFRYSDDDGRTWSDVTLIRPENNPDFLGMSVMRMCETEAGTWLLGSHEGRWVRKPELPVITRAYVLRSEDRGKTWTVLPDKRPGGWYLDEFERMDEPRPINLGGGKALILARTCEGHLWEIRSGDGGKTWEPRKKLGDVGTSTVDSGYLLSGLKSRPVTLPPETSPGPM